MLTLGPLGFLAPWLLTGLIALPAIWLILRVMPPSPKLVRFAGTRLLSGLKDAHPVARHVRELPGGARTRSRSSYDPYANLNVRE